VRLSFNPVGFSNFSANGSLHVRQNKNFARSGNETFSSPYSFSVLWFFVFLFLVFCLLFLAVYVLFLLNWLWFELEALAFVCC